MQPSVGVPPNGQNGIEGSHWVLEDHADLRAAHKADLFVRHLEQVLPEERCLSVYDFPGRCGNEAQEGHHRDAFAATAFTDHPQGFPLGKVKTDTIHRMHYAFWRVETGYEFLDFEESRTSIA